MKFEHLVEDLLLEQPHMHFHVQNYEILFDPELETKDYKQGVEMFKKILSGENVTGKYNSSIRLPQGLESAFCRNLIKDQTSMSFIKLWLAAIGRKTKTAYTVKQFFLDTGMLQHLEK